MGKTPHSTSETFQSNSPDFFMAKKIQLGVAGCGYWGPNLIRNFRALPTCHLRMMYDLGPTRLRHVQKLYPEVAGSTDYLHMLNGVKLDAVVIATSVAHRFPGQGLRTKCPPPGSKESFPGLALSGSKSRMDKGVRGQRRAN
jgi:hypothetical protein